MPIIQPIQDYFAKFDVVKTPKVKIIAPFSGDEIDADDWAAGVAPDGSIVAKNILNPGATADSAAVSETAPTTNTNTNLTVSNGTINSLHRVIMASHSGQAADSLPSYNGYKDAQYNKKFADMLKENNIPAHISSGFRGAGSFRGGRTKSGRRSNHNRILENGDPGAHDITPDLNADIFKKAAAYKKEHKLSVQGDNSRSYKGSALTTRETFDILRQVMYSNQNVVNWFRSNRKGILEEVEHAVTSRTGATGPHFHCGLDGWAKDYFNERLTKGFRGEGWVGDFVDKYLKGEIQKGQEGMKIDFVGYEPTGKVESNVQFNEDLEDDDYYYPEYFERGRMSTAESPFVYTRDDDNPTGVGQALGRVLTSGIGNIKHGNNSNIAYDPSLDHPLGPAHNKYIAGYGTLSPDTLVNLTKQELFEKDTGGLHAIPLRQENFAPTTIMTKGTLGERCNNPFDISPSSNDIIKSIGSTKARDGQTFAIYKTRIDGIVNAMRLYYTKYNGMSIRTLNNGVQGFNDQLIKQLGQIGFDDYSRLKRSWITNVAKYLGINPRIRLNLSDKNTMFMLLSAIGKYETGTRLSLADLEQAWAIFSKHIS